MASTSVQQPPQQASKSFGDYIPDDFADFGGLFSEDEQTNAGAKSSSARAQQKNADGTAGLGIDTEVSVKKRAREPRVKLDESRLLSAHGIPALRKQARVLKLKGKGHEFSDASRLLSMYQLWLDNLFPKARFADALAMVEKEGHKTGMHKMRMEWINESKPRDREDEMDGTLDGTATSHPDERLGEPQQPQQQSHVLSTGGNSIGEIPDDLFGEDLYDATPAPSAQAYQASVGRDPAAYQVPDESELDDLMAMAMEVHGPDDYERPPEPVLDDDFDDLEALMAEAEAAT